MPSGCFTGSNPVGSTPARNALSNFWADSGQIIFAESSRTSSAGISTPGTFQPDDDRMYVGFAGLGQSMVLLIRLAIDAKSRTAERANYDHLYGGKRRSAAAAFSASTPGALRDGRRFIVAMAIDITEP